MTVEGQALALAKALLERAITPERAEEMTSHAWDLVAARADLPLPSMEIKLMALKTLETMSLGETGMTVREWLNLYRDKQTVEAQPTAERQPATYGQKTMAAGGRTA